MGKGIAPGDLQGWMLGPEDIQKECRETTQDAQEAEGSNDPQEQHCLGVHAEIWGGGKPKLQVPSNTLGAGSAHLGRHSVPLHHSPKEAGDSKGCCLFLAPATSWSAEGLNNLHTSRQESWVTAPIALKGLLS
jgi:hypothetical protein